MLRKGKQIVGLSIGLDRIAVAELHTTASGVISVDRVAVADTPHGAVDGSGVVDIAAISRAIRGLLTSNGIKAKKVCLAISGKGAIMRLMTLPTMPRNEMLEVLKGEVENYAILSGSETVLDFRIMDVKAENTGQKSEVLYVAIPKEFIVPYVTAVEEANLKLLAIKTMPMAIFQSFTNSQFGPQTNAPTMLVDIEDSYGAISIVKDGSIKFVHDIDIERKRLSEDENAIRDLANEIQTSLNYHKTMSLHDEKIESIVLFMDGDNCDAILDELNRHLDIQVIRPYIHEYIRGYEEEKMGYDLLAYSAAGAIINNDKSINLLPLQKPEVLRLKRQLAVALLCVFTVALLSVFVNFMLEVKRNSIIRQEDLIRQSTAASDEQILRERAGVEARKAQLSTQVDAVASIVNSTTRVNWVSVLQEISAIIPENVWLTDFTWKEGNDAYFNGAALDYDSVFKFRNNLSDSEYFDSVKLISMQNNEAKNLLLLRFEIQCKISRETSKSQDVN